MSAPRRKLDVFPAFHRVEGRRVLVIGGGEEAAAKVRLLSETSARIVVIAPAIDKETGADMIGACGQWLPRGVVPADFADAALAFVATGDAAEDALIAAMARAAGVPVNVVDRPELCDFYTPAIVNRAPLAIAIGTAGVAPVLARHVRARIEGLLAPAFGDLAGLADRLRRVVTTSLATTTARRRYWAGFFSGNVAEKVFAGDIDGAEAEARASLAANASGAGHVSLAGAGHVSLVGAGPGAEDLLTLRAQRLLQEADVIVYDKLVPEAVVAMGRRDAARIYVGKAKGDHSMPQEAINAILVREAAEGKRVVRLKSGDPLIFGRAGEEMAALRAAGIAFDVVPGITAAFAAAAQAEIPLTLRGVAGSLVFASGHDADGETLPDWGSVALAGATVAVYMGLSVAGKVAARLMDAGLKASTPVAIIDNASRPDSQAYAGRLDELGCLAQSRRLRGPVLILIGDVVAQGALAVETIPLSEVA